MKTLWTIIHPPRKTRKRWLRTKLDPTPLVCKVESETRELFLAQADRLGVSPSERLRTLVQRDVEAEATSGKSGLPGSHLQRIAREFELAFADKTIDLLERDRLQYLWSLFERDVLYPGNEAA